MPFIPVFIVAALLLGICLYCFKICFYSSNDKPCDPYSTFHDEQYLRLKDSIYASTHRMEEVPFERVSTLSFDGMTLRGNYYHFHDGAPVKIIFHGYRSFALRDCAGGFALARKLGMNVLAVDQRAHGRSDGHVITFGVLERQDCLSWVQYVSNRFGEQTPVVLSGLSMGAATVVMATTLPLPQNVVCVLADCPYSSPEEIIRKVCRDVHFPGRIVYPFISVAATVFGKFRLADASATQAASQSKIPILLLHGEDDRFVPCEMSRKIHAASNGCTQLETFPEAGHGLSYMIDPARYEEVCINFLKNVPELKAALSVSDKL